MAVEMGEEAMRVVVRVAVVVVKVVCLLMMAAVGEADQGTGVVEISAVLTEEVGAAGVREEGREKGREEGVGVREVLMMMMEEKERVVEVLMTTTGEEVMGVVVKDLEEERVVEDLSLKKKEVEEMVMAVADQVVEARAAAGMVVG
ncbi:hypothetical protein CYMTET_27025 [Cymbomonas tetramitiformis]|uniref:Uncharacterized protein n=1 Tax=Cymbomonas tetramitiformis TaxID=36881 RepID=A0AAE0FRA5_9CHLO|nr:hypothetical protein CYMTET_27025 [Cymbomonas tetramitiformis]